MNNSLASCRHSPLRLQLGVMGASLLALAPSLFSLEVPAGTVQNDPQNQQQNATQTLSAESLNQLLAPIALYPDALIALILPASTVPSDVVLASRYVAGNGDPKQIPNQGWDNSVQSLASYPDVVTWMGKNLEWTTALGQAFLVQPADVMNAIQQLRTQAQAAGNLVDTPQQVIVKEKTFIRIVPAEPEYLYVPQYDPEIIYVQPYSQGYGPLITFGVGFAVGAWLNYDFDWNRHEIYRGDWQPGWDYGRNGNGGNNIVNVVNINQNTAQPWQASSRSRQQLTRQQQIFQADSNTLGAARTASRATAADANIAGQQNRLVPRPSRTNFGNRSAGNRNSATSNRQPAATATQPAAQPAAGTSTVRQTTTPPNVAGQQGKPLRNRNTANANLNANKRGGQPGNTGTQPLPSTIQVPQTPRSEKNSGNKNNNVNRATYPPNQTQRPQAMTAPHRQLQKAHAPPQQPTQAPNKHSSESMAKKPASQPQPRQQPRQQPQQQQQPKQQQQAQQPRQQQQAQQPRQQQQAQQQKQQPQQQQPRQQQQAQQPRQQQQAQQPRQQQQPSSGGKRQEKKAAPPATKQNPAPAAQPEGQQPDKESDKKKK